MTALQALYAWAVTSRPVEMSRGFIVAASDGDDETVTFDLWWLLLVLAIILILILIWRYFPRRR